MRCIANGSISPTFTVLVASCTRSHWRWGWILNATVSTATAEVKNKSIITLYSFACMFFLRILFVLLHWLATFVFQQNQCSDDNANRCVICEQRGDKKRNNVWILRNDVQRDGWMQAKCIRLCTLLTNTPIWCALKSIHLQPWWIHINANFCLSKIAFSHFLIRRLFSFIIDFCLHLFYTGFCSIFSSFL